MTKRKTPTDHRLPSDLSPAARAWGVRILAEFQVDDAAGLLLLAEALRAWDRAREAGVAIAKDGAIVKDRFDQHRAHPAINVERDARGSMLAAFRALHLDIEPPKATGRPTR
jgi:phage terminase small subunit